MPGTLEMSVEMSDEPAHGDRMGLGYGHIRARWGWFVALGIVLIALGVFALGEVVAVTLASVIFIGAMLLVGGIFQILHAFLVRGWGAFTWQLLGGVFYVIGGLLIMDEPVQGSLVVTLFLVAALIVGGVLRVTIGMRHRDMQGWWLLLLGGAVSLIVAVLLLLQLPWSGLWVLGTLIAIELIFMGFNWLQFGLSLRRLKHAA